jgi:hypothetical protein
VCVCACVFVKVCVCVCVCVGACSHVHFYFSEYLFLLVSPPIYQALCLLRTECVFDISHRASRHTSHTTHHTYTHTHTQTLSASARISSGQVALNIAVCLSVGPSPALGHLENIYGRVR